MACKPKKFHALLLVGLRIVAFALDGDSTCTRNPAECLNPTAADDDDVSHSEFSLLQTKLGFDKEIDVDLEDEEGSDTMHSGSTKSVDFIDPGVADPDLGETEAHFSNLAWMPGASAQLLQEYVSKFEGHFRQWAEKKFDKEEFNMEEFEEEELAQEEFDKQVPVPAENVDPTPAPIADVGGPVTTLPFGFASGHGTNPGAGDATTPVPDTVTLPGGDTNFTMPDAIENFTGFSNSSMADRGITIPDGPIFQWRPARRNMDGSIMTEPDEEGHQVPVPGPVIGGDLVTKEELDKSRITGRLDHGKLNAHTVLDFTNSGMPTIQETDCLKCIEGFENVTNATGPFKAMGPYVKYTLCTMRESGWMLPHPCEVCMIDLEVSCTGGFSEEDRKNYAKLNPFKYVPGRPGGPWTKFQVLAVKAKMYRLYAVGEGLDVYNKLKPGHSIDPDRDLLRLAAKSVRLAFHDCFRYKDGSGGCDGCLQWQGFGDAFNASNGKKGLFTQVKEENHHNGLQPYVEIMEAIYTNRAFPERTPILPRSLQESGISRADLWQLAGIAAIEYAIETNNGVCNDPRWEERYHGKEGLGFSSVPHCHHMENYTKEGCIINLKRRFLFRYGRADCGKDYVVSKKENHPDALEDGVETARFFHKTFGFSGRDTVAIFGAHTLGRIHFENSMLRYNWVKNGDGLFNNFYYKNLMGEKSYRYVRDSCQKSGDMNGNPALVRWLTLVQNDNVKGGPYQFIQEIKSCPDECSMDNWNVEECCPARGKCNQTCEMWRVGSPPFDNTIVTALGAEMGLYLEFTEVDGLPTGCKGLQDFTYERFAEDPKWRWSGENGVKGETQCAKQRFALPAGSMPLYKLVELYAKDQDRWLHDFAIAYEKMTSNGYRSMGINHLYFGPNQYKDIKCPPQDKRHPENRFWICYNDKRLSVPFMIKSLWDDRVIQEKSDGKGGIEMNELLPEGRPHSARQLWQATEYHRHFINYATGSALVIDGEAQWVYLPRSDYIISRGSGLVMGREMKKSNFANVSMSIPSENEGMKWGIVGPIARSTIETLTW